MRDPFDEYAMDAIRALEDDLAAVRAVLAPLMDHPWYYVGCLDAAPSTDIYSCKFCEATNHLPPGPGSIRDIETWHVPDCPVLRKDTLLGRD